MSTKMKELSEFWHVDCLSLTGENGFISFSQVEALEKRVNW